MAGIATRQGEPGNAAFDLHEAMQVTVLARHADCDLSARHSVAGIFFLQYNHGKLFVRLQTLAAASLHCEQE